MAAPPSRRHPADTGRDRSRRHAQRDDDGAGETMRRPARDSARTETRSSGARPDAHRSRNGNPGRESSAALVAEIERQTAILKQSLHGTRKSVPWDAAVLGAARKLRTAHVVLLVEHYTNPAAQGIDALWMTSSYWLIGAYRGMIADVERRVGAAGVGGGVGGKRRGGGGEGERERESGPVELRKLLTRFQRFLTSEIAFYQWLVRTLVARFDLFGRHVEGAEVKGYLAMLREGLDVMDESEGGDDATGQRRSSSEDERAHSDRFTTLDTTPLHLSREETHKKLQLVHKTLLCLGDISRYKELYGPERDRKRWERDGGAGRRNGKPGPAGGRVKEQDERFDRAKRYYAVAKGVLPDNGAFPFSLLQTHL